MVASPGLDEAGGIPGLLASGLTVLLLPVFSGYERPAALPVVDQRLRGSVLYGMEALTGMEFHPVVLQVLGYDAHRPPVVFPGFPADSPADSQGGVHDLAVEAEPCRFEGVTTPAFVPQDQILGGPCGIGV